ncbi:MAG: hypothetical protein AAF629_25270 [Chloroflexota bacterium]
MTPASEHLIALARTITLPYTQLPTARAAMITGSAAKGLSDQYSDIDLTIYYEDVLPPEADFQTIREANGGSERKWMMGNYDDGHFAEAYHVDGIEVQIGHTTIAAWEETIKYVLEAQEVDTPAQKAMEGTLACQALYGDDYIHHWKEQIAAYPDILAEAMVRENLRFFAVWGLNHHFQTRDATIWYYQIMVETAHKLVAVLAGINRLYFTTFQFKRMHKFIDEMKIKPDNLAGRIEALFQSDMSQVLPDLEQLVSETVELVETHMPQVDTSAAKARLGWQHQPWQL